MTALFLPLLGLLVIIAVVECHQPQLVVEGDQVRGYGLDLKEMLDFTQLILSADSGSAGIRSRRVRDVDDNELTDQTKDGHKTVTNRDDWRA